MSSTASSLASQPNLVPTVSNTSPQQPVNSKFIRHLIGSSSTKINEMQKIKAVKNGENKGVTSEPTDDVNVIFYLNYI